MKFKSCLILIEVIVNFDNNVRFKLNFIRIICNLNILEWHFCNYFHFLCLISNFCIIICVYLVRFRQISRGLASILNSAEALKLSRDRRIIVNEL